MRASLAAINEAVELYQPLTNQHWAIHKHELDHSLRVLVIIAG